MMQSMQPLKESVSLVITKDNGEFLAVKRPDDPNDLLAGLWGFPAVSLHPGESRQDGARRVGQQKLGVKIELGEPIGDSTHERDTYTLHMTDYKAKIISGEPKVPQGDTSVTQYSECQYFTDHTILIPAARKGSQCVQLFLRSLGVDWQKAKA